MKEVFLSLINAIVIMAIIFGVPALAIHQNNYWWLWMWCFLLVIDFNATKK